MKIQSITENSAVSGSDGGRGTANIVYILYILGFFFGVTALVGVILAYVNRDESRDPFRSHLAFQIKVFWRGVFFCIAIVLSYLLAMGIGVATLGLGFLLMIIPFALGAWWLIWTILAIVKGMRALWRGEPIAL